MGGGETPSRETTRPVPRGSRTRVYGSNSINSKYHVVPRRDPQIPYSKLLTTSSSYSSTEAAWIIVAKPCFLDPCLASWICPEHDQSALQGQGTDNSDLAAAPRVAGGSGRSRRKGSRQLMGGEGKRRGLSAETPGEGRDATLSGTSWPGLPSAASAG